MAGSLAKLWVEPLEWLVAELLGLFDRHLGKMVARQFEMARLLLQEEELELDESQSLDEPQELDEPHELVEQLDLGDQKDDLERLQLLEFLVYVHLDEPMGHSTLISLISLTSLIFFASSSVS